MNRTRLATFLACLLAASLLVPMAAVAEENLDGVLISETANRGPGGGYDNFIEIANYGDSAFDLSGWEVYRCTSSGSQWTSPQVPAFDGLVLGAGETYLLAHQNSSLTDVADETYSGSLANTGYGVLVEDATDAIVDRMAAYGDGGASDSDCAEGNALANDLSGDESFHRVSDTGDNASDYTKASRTPGSSDGGGGDPGGDPSSCDNPTPIHDINTVGADGLPSTDMLGEQVAVEGVVTASFLSGLDAFFVQEPQSDPDDPDSHGIMVYAPSQAETAVAAGDLLCVTGQVDEFNGTVQLSNVTIDTVATGEPLPAAAQLVMPVADRTELARLAGMRVELTSSNGAMTVSQNYFQGQYGELDLSASGWLWNPTELHDPNTELSLVEAERESNLNSLIKLDDASSGTNPSPTPWLANGARRAGAETSDPIAGITHYQHGSYRIQPTAPGDIAFTNTANPRPIGPPDVLAGTASDSETITVAGFNVLNYFTTLRSRGAYTQEEFELQAAKIVTALTTMDADVVGLMEIENNFGSGDDALVDLLERLNAKAGEGTYAAHGHDRPFGSDAISNAIIYRPDSVTPVGELAIADHAAFVDPLGTGTDRNRPAVTQAFETATGDRFVVAVNHLKSKGSSCGSGDDDLWQGNCNGTRSAGAEELVRWLSEDDPTGTGTAEVAIIGDLNAYAQEDPVQAFLDGGYQDTLADQAGDVYTYTFDAEHGRLDHGLVSDELAGTGWLVDADVWHINTDEPSAFDYKSWNNPEDQDTSEFRSSDHDPIIIGLDFGPAPDDPGDPGDTELQAEFGEPRGKVATGKTIKVPFTVTDANGNGVTGADVTVEVVDADGAVQMAEVSEKRGGDYQAAFATQAAGEASLTAFDAQGQAIGSTTVVVE